MEWYRKFFSDLYPRICQSIFPEVETLKEVGFIEEILELPASAKILDLCSGHGRHAIELAKRGYFVVCQDLNEKLLQIAEKRAKELGVRILTICKDMREIPFENEFDGIINMWTSFGYLENDEEDFEVLRQIAKALNSSGKFLIDLDNQAWVFQHFEEGQEYKFGQLKVFETSQLEIGGGRIRKRLVLLEKNKKAGEMELVIRIYTLKELEQMLTSVGLQIKKVYGGFEKDKYSNYAPRMIVLSQKMK